MLDHGGDLSAASERFGGELADWIDLSTGINRLAYPIPGLPPRSLQCLPDRNDLAELASIARVAYRVGTKVACLPVAGAQAAIRLLPAIRPAGRVAICTPTYNEHAAAFSAAGWQVTKVGEISALHGFDAIVIVNPNNPDGRSWSPETLLSLSRTNGLMIVDESFADAHPEVSVCPMLDQSTPGVIVLRSFGKFYGLAGLRLGFALGAEMNIARLAAAAGPWAVSGPALAAGRIALTDRSWSKATCIRLTADASRLDALASAAGLDLVGGTNLFRLYRVEDAAAAQAHLARTRIWSRIFPYSRTWIRLGIPGPDAEWKALAASLSLDRLSRDGEGRCP